MQENLEKALIDLGLGLEETKVYLALLSLGPTTILKISQTTFIKRTTIYSIFNLLQKKGLVRIEIKGLKKLYAAEDPTKLQKLWNKKIEQFNSVLPEFQSLYRFEGNQSSIKYYEGLESVKDVYEKLLDDIKPGEDYLVMTAQEEWYSLDAKFFQKFIERRAKLPIAIRLLMQDSTLARKHKKFEKNYNEHIKILPAGTLLTTNLVITPERVVIHQLTKPDLAIVIENSSVIRMHREQFEIMWKSLP